MPWTYDDWRKIVDATPAEREAEARQLQQLKIAHAEATAVDRHNLAQNIEAIEAWRDDPEFHDAVAELANKRGGDAAVPAILEEIIARETAAVKERFAHVQGGELTLHLIDSKHLAAFKSGMNEKG